MTQVEQLFSAWFFEKEKIKPIVVDIEDIDLETVFIPNLIQSLKGGFDKSRPLIVAKSAIKEIDGQLIDGLHRSYAIQRLYDKEKLRVVPTVVREEIKDIDHLRARRLHYELINQSKNIVVSNHKADKNFLQVMQAHPELQTLEQVMTFFFLKGFYNKTTLTVVYNRYNAVNARKQAYQERAKKLAEAVERPEDKLLNSDWTHHSLDKDSAIAEDKVTKQRIICKHCSSELIVFIAENRIEHVEVLSTSKLS